jgi:hypothetical protein
MENIKSNSEKVNSKNKPLYKQYKTEENEQLRKFLIYYANMSKQKRVIIFFMKRTPASDSSGRESLLPVQISLGANRSLGLELEKSSYSNIRYNKGFVLYSRNITNNICENILQESSDPNRKIEVFFSVQELKKNVRKEDEILNITTFPYFDDVPSSNINQELISDNYTLNDFPFPIQFAAETSPGNFQLFWSLKYPQPVKNVNYWKQALSVMKIVGNHITGHVDSGGSNINQIYRLPNTYNYKTKYKQPAQTKLLCFNKSNAIEFRQVWTWILNKYIEIKYKSFHKKYNEIIKLLNKEYDYTILENITGDFEHHANDTMTPSERSMSIIKRLSSKYKLNQEDIYKFWKETPNEEKSKGHLTKNQKQYFDRMFQKISPKEKKLKIIKKSYELTASQREPSIIQASEVPKIFTGRKMKEVFKANNRTITRLSTKGMSEKKGQLLLWLIAQAVKNNFVFEVPTSEFFEKFKLSDKTFWDFQESVKIFAINDTKFESLKQFKSKSLSFINYIKRESGKIQIELTEDFKKVYNQERSMRKLFDSTVINSLDDLKERYAFSLLLQLNFILYDQKYNGSITLSDLANRTGINITNTEAAVRKFASRVRKAFDEIIKKKLLNFSYEYDSKNKQFIFQKHKALTN